MSNNAILISFLVVAGLVVFWLVKELAIERWATLRGLFSPHLFSLRAPAPVPQPAPVSTNSSAVDADGPAWPQLHRLPAALRLFWEELTDAPIMSNEPAADAGLDAADQPQTSEPAQASPPARHKSATVPLTELEEDLIAWVLEMGKSANNIVDRIGGDRTLRLKQIAAVRSSRVQFAPQPQITVPPMEPIRFDEKTAPVHS